MLIAVSTPAFGQTPDAAPPASGPAPDPAPQAAPAPARAAPPPPAAEQPAANTPAASAPALATEPAAQPARPSVAAQAAKPKREPSARRERARRSRPATRRNPTPIKRQPSLQTFGTGAIPATVPPPRLVIKRGSQLATAEARLAALALLVAAAGSLGLIAHLRREGLE